MEIKVREVSGSGEKSKQEIQITGFRQVLESIK